MLPCAPPARDPTIDLMGAALMFAWFAWFADNK
jgi:hypothetical protein